MNDLKYYICIDDTDNYESIGTGELLENLCFEAKRRKLGKAGFIVRYQLFIHEDIPYTSHNSSMCVDFETDSPDELYSFACTYLTDSSAEGSDPGICMLRNDESIDYSSLLDFGIRATKEVVTKQEAYSLAEFFGPDVMLSEHGGTGIGVIGALAGAALRAGKAEGKIKGKLYPPEDKNEFSFEEFSQRYHIEQFTDEEEKIVEDTGETIEFWMPTKTFYINGKITAILCRDENGSLVPKPKKPKKEKK